MSSLVLVWGRDTPYSFAMHKTEAYRYLILSLVASSLLWVDASAARELFSYASINQDGSLQIEGKTVHLYGIHLPDTGRTCRSNRNPAVCGSRAVIALDHKIDGFVRCEILGANRDGSLVGWCRVEALYFDEGEDLSAYLLEQGWAVALPDAPFEYHTLEKISRVRGFGLWGMPVDRRISPGRE
jgi:endonuclease YncB( thermonuclease family)